MKTIVIVGTGSGCGKTTVACRILRAVPGLGAVKVSPRQEPVRVEWGAGSPGKDTDRYAGCGAAPVARIVAPRDQVAAAWEGVRGGFEGCRGVVIEGSRGLEIPADRLVVFVRGERSRELRPGREAELASKADFIIERVPPEESEGLLESIRSFLSDPIRGA